jgi:hypothetical protein
MTFIRSLSFLTVLFMTLLLAGNASATTAETRLRSKTKPSKTLLIFEKKPCFGFCPVYKATFMKNGKVLVTYRQPGKEEASTSFTLPKGEVDIWWGRGAKLGFFKMKDRFDTQKTDWPEREITLYKKGKPKTVIYSEGGTSEFEAYLADLAALVEGKINVNFGPPGR